MRARGLLTHEADGFRERGLAGAFSFDPEPSGRGLRLKTVGASATSGADALLGRETLVGFGRIARPIHRTHRHRVSRLQPRQRSRRLLRSAPEDGRRRRGPSPRPTARDPTCPRPSPPIPGRIGPPPSGSRARACRSSRRAAPHPGRDGPATPPADARTPSGGSPHGPPGHGVRAHAHHVHHDEIRAQMTLLLNAE